MDGMIDEVRKSGSQMLHGLAIACATIFVMIFLGRSLRNAM
jgi:hypothetical protein